ncbi:MAG: hypothetical protein J3T61_05890 [Candidatus Brocadiales bacterium]|nr:hypothetical protein [Candidatus Bathyanammoxibius sp.]
MATVEQRRKALEAATAQVADLAAVDPKALARTSDLSPDINFNDAVPHFEEMLELCKQLSQRDISRLPVPQLTAITVACTKLSSLIQQVRDFTLNQNTPGDVCKSIIVAIESAYDEVMNPLLLPLAFTATQATDYVKIEREAKGYHATMKTEAENLAAFIESVHGEAESALAAVKEQAAEAGVSTNAHIFAGDAKKHHDLAQLWLKATIWMAVGTFVAAIAALVTAFIYHPDDLTATVQYIVAKLLVLSILSFGILWCARNYKSQKHNETLNQHRANALMTFRAFVEGTSDNRVKDAILLQAAQAAFSSRPTGFDAPEKDSQAINPVVEILGRTLPHATDGG